MTKLNDYIINNLNEILVLLYNHIEYTFLAILLAILIGVPLGIIIYNSKNLDKPVLSIANLIQAIPSLAILGFIVPYLGIGASTAIFMVVLYSLLPILKNTYTGLSNINKDTIEAAQGIGMTNLQILYKVQIPLALPVIMAGVRISAVTAVGLMTIAAYIGAEVLGTLIISGIQTDNSSMIFAGAIPACILALTMDFFMSRIEKAVTPISLRLSASAITPKKIAKLKRFRKATTLATASMLCFALITFGVGHFSSQADITVGSKESVEGRIVGNIIADCIEAKTDLKVERKMGLGGTMIAFNALKTNEIDIYPEYTGTLLTTVLNNKFAPGTNSDEIYTLVKNTLQAKHQLFSLNPYQINNTYVLAVTPATAQKYKLKTISDLARVSSRLKLGCTPEFAVRADGLKGMDKTYGTAFQDVLNFSGTLMYTAIDAKEVDVITAFATDSLVDKYQLQVLKDDANFFPPYDLFPLASSSLADKYPEVVDILNELSPLLDDNIMRKLNGMVVEGGLAPTQVAETFLKEHKIIK